LENKTQIGMFLCLRLDSLNQAEVYGSISGKVDEILGPINEVYFTVKMQEGMLSTSFKKEDKVYIGGDKLLPIERFLPKPKAPASKADSEYQ